MEKREEARKMALDTLHTDLSKSLFAEPIEYILADHFRQRTLCGILDEIAQSEIFDVELVTAALRFLKCEFGPHVLDEEEDLFPLLKRRASADDDINQVLGQLSEEHATDEVDANEIIDQLSRLLDPVSSTGLSPEAKALLKRFATNERHHLILENAIVLPLARVRLTEEDCKHLGQCMAARRGIVLSETGYDQ